MTEAAIAITDISAETLGMNPNDQMAKRFADETRRDIGIKMKYVSPPGALGLPELLDERRCGFAVPDAVFRVARGALYDRVLLWCEIPDADFGETGKASKSIYLPPTSQKANQEKSPRCLIVGAGLQALDVLRSNGSDLGHIVYLVHLNPWWIPCGRSQEGTEWWVRVVSAGDLGADEDLANDMQAGKVTVVEHDDGLVRLCRVEDDKTAELLNKPILPEMSPGY